MKFRFLDHIIFQDDAEFESKHKRDDDGKFSKNQGLANANPNKRPSEKQLARAHKVKTIEEFYGEEIKGRGLTGRRAVSKLVELQRGHIKSAFHRDDLGDIDLVWGDERAGLCHAIYRRTIHNENVQNVINGIANTIANGRRDIENEDARNFVLRRGDMRVVISKSFKENDRTRLMITAYEIG